MVPHCTLIFCKAGADAYTHDIQGHACDTIEGERAAHLVFEAGFRVRPPIYSRAFRHLRRHLRASLSLSLSYSCVEKSIDPLGVPTSAHAFRVYTLLRRSNNGLLQNGPVFKSVARSLAPELSRGEIDVSFRNDQELSKGVSAASALAVLPKTVVEESIVY